MKEQEKTWIDNYLPGCFTSTEGGILDWLQKTWLVRAGYKRVIRNGDDYIFAPGTLPVLMVCHLDTVHNFKRADIALFHDRENQCLWSPHGIGGDDRAGLIAILEILRLKHRPWLLFTTGEERGGKGAKSFCRSDVAALTGADGSPNIKYMVEVDRKGHKEAVFYGCSTVDKWTQYVEGWGFEKETGTYSDISDIMRETGICGVNLSAGYYMNHTNTEFVLYEQLRKTILKISRQFYKLPETPFTYTPYVYKATKVKYYKEEEKKQITHETGHDNWLTRWRGKGDDIKGKVADNIVELYRHKASPGEDVTGKREGRTPGINTWLHSIGRPACIVDSCLNILTIYEARTNGICLDCNLDYDRMGTEATWEGSMDGDKVTELCEWLTEEEEGKRMN